MECNSDVDNEPWLTFFWDIKNFSYCWQKREEYILSPTVELKENISWNLLLFPRRGENENILFAIRGQWNDGSESISVDRELVLLANDGTVCPKISRGKKTFQKNYPLSYELIIKRDEVTKSKSEIFLFEDTLRVRCRLWRTEGKVVTPETVFSKTVLRVNRDKLVWPFPKSSSLESGRKRIFVQKSESKDDEVILNIALNDEDKIMIKIASFYKNVEFAIFQSFLIDAKGRKIDCGKSEIFPEEFYTKAVCTLPFTKKNFMETFFCFHLEYSWCDGIDISKISVRSNRINDKLSRSGSDMELMDKGDDLKEDLKNLFDERILSDAILRTKYETFHVHKAILSARSPVFRELFSTEVEKKVMNDVDVSDLEDDTVRRMLRYVYSNVLENLGWKSAYKLYVTASKYKITALEKKCSFFLSRNLCLSNVCLVMRLADKLKDDDLKNAAKEYVLEHNERYLAQTRGESWRKKYLSDNEYNEIY